MSEGLVKVTDKFGQTRKVANIFWDGEKYNVPIPFKGMPKNLRDQLKDLKTLPTDVWLNSYVKSGTHWMHEVLDIILHGYNSEDIKGPASSWLEKRTQMEEYDNMPSPRLLGTHIPLRRLPDNIQQSKIVYVARNPLSVVISHYHHTNKTDYYGYTGTLEQYIETYAEELYTLYGSWFDHVFDAYTRSKQGSNILMIYYEEMRENPAKAIQELSDFLEIGITPERKQEIVQQTSLANMKDRYNSKQDTDLHNRVRKGETSEWKGHTSKEFVDGFMEMYHRKLKDYPELMARIKL